MKNCQISQNTLCKRCDINYYFNNGRCSKSNAYETSHDDRNLLVRGIDSTWDFSRGAGNKIEDGTKDFLNNSVDFTKDTASSFWGFLRNTARGIRDIF